eukprot:gene9452-14668_t
MAATADNELAERFVAKEVERVAATADRWAALPDKKKLEYLRAIRNATEACSKPWAEASAQERGTDGLPHVKKQVYGTGPALFAFALAAVTRTYEALAKTGKPPALRKRTVGEHLVIPVFPGSTSEKLLLPITAEVWLEPGKPATQGQCRKKTGVMGILSAGNFEAPTDVLYSMFVESRVVVYSRHANLARSNKYCDTIFKCLADEGFFATLEPGLPLATALTLHPKVDCLMMTGGHATYDKIVWGSDEAKAAGVKRVDKPFHAELGAVSPYIVVPWDGYSNKDVDVQAAALAGFKLLNASAVCASPQLVIVGKHWKQRDAFFEKVANCIENALEIPIFYSGTQERTDAAEKAYAGCKEVIKPRAKGSLKPVIIRGLTEADVPSFSLENEAFAPVLVELVLDCEDPKAFLEKVVRITNSDDVFGSLSCSMVLHPGAEKALGAQYLDDVLRRLEWGTVTLNNWAGMGPYMGAGVWGAFPKHTPSDIQSGMGFIGNSLMLDYPQKQVMRSPWNNMFLPKGGPTEREVCVYEPMTYFALKPGLWRLLKVGVAAAPQ